MLPLTGHIREIHPSHEEPLNTIQGELDLDSTTLHHLKPIDYFDNYCLAV